MKLDDMLSISDKLDKGVEFEVFKNIIAYVRTINKNEFEIKLNREIFRYLSEHDIDSALDIPDDEYIKLQNKVVIKAIIKDVKGIEDSEGNEKEWSESFALELLEEPRSKEFFNRIFDFATIITAKEYSLADNYTKKK